MARFGPEQPDVNAEESENYKIQQRCWEEGGKDTSKMNGRGGKKVSVRGKEKK